MINARRSWLSTEEAADYLGFAVKTLQNWRSEGTGPRYKRLRNRCFYPLEYLHDFQDKKSEDKDTIYFASIMSPVEVASLLNY